MLNSFLISAVAAMIASNASTPNHGDACPPDFASTDAECRVVGGGDLGEGVRYELYRVTDGLSNGGIYDAPPYYQTAAALYFEGTADPARFGPTDLGDSWFDTQKLINANGVREVVLVRQLFAGTGAFITDHLFVRDGDRWMRLAPSLDLETMQGFVAELSGRLPEGLAIWKGVAVDYSSLTGTSSLWRADDANCCPSGGTVRFTLKLDREKMAFVIDKVETDARSDDSDPSEWEK